MERLSCRPWRGVVYCGHALRPSASCRSRKPNGHAVPDLTEEDAVSPLRLVVDREGGERSYGPAVTPSDRLLGQGTAPEVSGVFGPTTPHLQSSSSWKNTDSSLTQTQEREEEEEEEATWGGPQFIMPLAPLSIAPSSFRRTNRALEGGQDRVKSWLHDRKAQNGAHIKPPLGQETPDAAAPVAPGPPHEEVSHLLLPRGGSLAIWEAEHVAYVTLDLRDPVRSQKPSESKPNGLLDHKMPDKTAKGGLEGKARPKKDKSAGCRLPASASKKLENVTEAPHSLTAQQVAKVQGNHLPPVKGHEDEEASLAAVIENIAIAEKATPKPHGKKKKKHSQSAAILKSETEPLVEVENGARQKTGAKGKIEIFETKQLAQAVKVKNKPTAVPSKNESVHSGANTANPMREPACLSSKLKDDVIKRRRMSDDKFGKRLQKFENVGLIRKEETVAGVCKANKKAFSDVVKTPPQTEAPREVQPIHAVAVTDDPQSLCLWCQFTTVFSDHTVSWTKEGTVLSEVKRSSGDESRVSVNIYKATNKDLGRYQCRLVSPQGSLGLDYLLTYEVLSEIVIPVIPENTPKDSVEVAGEEEDVNCCALLFHEDFLKEQYFGEDQAASLVTERVHFGEGMHRRAFRARLRAGMASTFAAGHACVLKVHNAVAYGTRNNEEMVKKNYNLAVEECSVQNTARAYINVYSAIAQSAESFGDVPEIIPVYLVHRPSSDVPYATLEEELKGDFVKYSVRDGKEINLMRRDSEAGQKCCCFQHWIYHSTEGNLLVTDMQGVGMRLTDVGIATREKGYNGFKGNCATSFIDQFKALHLCNKYCELLGLKSLQPKPKKHGHGPRSQTQPAAKKKTGQPVKNKS